MTTYPAHGVHLRQPHPNRWLVVGIVVAAALVGVGVWALVDHYTGDKSKGISNAQAITFIQTGTGLPGLNVMNGNPSLHGTAMPAMERPYAMHMYRGGPYQARMLNLFYALGAVATHFQPKADRQATLSMGRSKLTALLVAEANAPHPEWITQYGVTVRQAAAAVVQGMFAGAK